MPTGKQPSLVEAHIEKALHKVLQTPISTGHSAVLYRFVSFFWSSVVYLELICTSFSVACKATCLMHIFITSDALHRACVYLLYSVSFAIISLLLHASSSASSVPVPPALHSPLSFSLSTTIHHLFYLQGCHDCSRVSLLPPLGLIRQWQPEGFSVLTSGL